MPLIESGLASLLLAIINVYVVTFIYTVYDTDYTVIHMYRHCIASLLTVPNSLHRFRGQPWAVLTMIHAVILSLPSLALLEFKLIPGHSVMLSWVWISTSSRCLIEDHVITTIGGMVTEGRVDIYMNSDPKFISLARSSAPDPTKVCRARVHVRTCTHARKPLSVWNFPPET